MDFVREKSLTLGSRNVGINSPWNAHRTIAKRMNNVAYQQLIAYKLRSRMADTIELNVDQKATPRGSDIEIYSTGSSRSLGCRLDCSRCAL